MTITTTRRSAAASVFLAAALTMSACGSDDATPTDSTSTASAPTQSQDEKDLAAAVDVTEKFYAENIGKDRPVPTTRYATTQWVETVKTNVGKLANDSEYRGPEDRVLWVKPSQRGQQGATTRVCIEGNRIEYRDGKPVSTTPEGKLIKRGETRELLVSLVQQDDTWKVDQIQYEKAGCKA